MGVLRAKRFLKQAHSWSPFHISESGFRKVATAFKVWPSFLKVVHHFGQPEAGYETGPFLGGYDCWSQCPEDDRNPLEQESYGQLVILDSLCTG